MEKKTYLQQNRISTRSRKPTISNSRLFIVYLFVTFLVYTLPYFKLKIPYILAALLMLVSIPFLINRNGKLLNYTLGLFLVSFYFIVRYSFFPGYGLTDAINEGIRNIRFFLPVLWADYILRACSKKKIKYFLVFFFLTITFMLVKTLGALESDPMIARILAQGSEISSAKINAYRLDNIGGFEFSYMMGILAMCFLWLFFTQKKWIKWISLAIYFVLFYYIIQSQYTTLLLLTFLGSAVLLFCISKNSGLKILLAIFALILIFNIVPICNFLSNLFAGTLLETKFQQITDSITYNNADALGKRPELLLSAFKTWLENPIFGAYAENSNAHSLIMTTLAHTGLVGLILWGGLVVQAYKIIKQQLKKYEFGVLLFQCATVYLICLSFLNPIGYVFELTIMIYCVLVMFIKLFAKEKEW